MPGSPRRRAAQAAGISRNHLQVIEKGLSHRANASPWNPHLSVLIELCGALDVTLADVVIEVFGPPSKMVVEYTGSKHPGSPRA